MGHSSSSTGSVTWSPCPTWLPRTVLWSNWTATPVRSWTPFTPPTGRSGSSPRPWCWTGGSILVLPTPSTWPGSPRCCVMPTPRKAPLGSHWGLTSQSQGRTLEMWQSRKMLSNFCDQLYETVVKVVNISDNEGRLLNDYGHFSLRIVKFLSLTLAIYV